MAHFSFLLVLFWVLALATTAAPTDSDMANIMTPNDELDDSDADVCQASVAPAAMLDLRRIERRAYCHFKVCENRYGNRGGKTRNPDTIYRVICEETAHCKQAYLTVQVTVQKDGVLQSSAEAVPAGCVYTLTDLRRPTEATHADSDSLV
jgi:hypothetical protein